MDIRAVQQPRRAHRITAVAVVVAFTSAGVSGCSSQAPAGDDQRARQPAAAVHEHEVEAAAVDELDAVDLRVKLEQLLGQHAILTVRLTRARLRNDGDLAQSADAALTKNTADMGELIGSVYGSEAAQEFEQMWLGHVTDVFNYSRGVADGDEDVKAQARRQLDEYVTELSQFLDAATNQAAPASVVAAEFRMHVDQLLQQVDAYAGGDYELAITLERESYAHMFPLGKLWPPVSLPAGVRNCRPTSTAQLPNCSRAWACFSVNTPNWLSMPCVQESPALLIFRRPARRLMRIRVRSRP